MMQKKSFHFFYLLSIMFVQQNIVFVLALSFEKSRGILLMLVQYYLDDDFRFRKNHHLIRMEDRIFSLTKIDDRKEIKMLFPQREECKSPSFQDS